MMRTSIHSTLSRFPASLSAFLFLLCLGLVVSSPSLEAKEPAKKAAAQKASAAKKAAPKKKVRKVNPAMAKVTDVEGLPRVLLIGDSISIGYTVGVREGLKGKANVHRPLTNCGPTTRGVAAIDQWIATGGADKTWDVIHFNWGLHDLKYMGPKGQNLADPKAETSKPQVSQADYEAHLDTLVTRLKKTGATIIWRNTTPVPEGAAGRVVGDSVVYNNIAAKVMKKHGVQTHDLYQFAFDHADEIQLKANVHYSAAGSAKLATEVVKVIEAALPAKTK